MAGALLRSLLLLFLWALPLAAGLGEARPIGELRYAPLGGETLTPKLAWSGGWLVTWSGGEGAARLDASGAPIDVPAIYLGARSWSEAAVVGVEDGWVFASFTADGVRFDQLDRNGDRVSRQDIAAPVPGSISRRTLVEAGGRLAFAWSTPPGSEASPKTSILSIADGGIESFDGEMVDLAAAGDRLYLALHDRLLEIGPGLELLRTLPLPESLIARDLVEREGGVQLITDDRIWPFPADPPSIQVHSVTPVGLVEVARLTTPTHPDYVQGAYSGDELLLAWLGVVNAEWIYSRTYALFAARIDSSGAIEGPVRIEESVETTNRYFPSPDRFDLGGDEQGWMIARSSGLRSPTAHFLDVVTRRIDRSSPLAPFEEPATIAGWRAPDQWLVGAPSVGETTLIVWREVTISQKALPGRWYGVRVDTTGARVDPHDLLLPDETWDVVATSDGYLLFTSTFPAEVYRLRNGSSELELVPFARAGSASSACAGEICLDATVISESGRSRIRVIRRRGGEPLDPGGLTIAEYAQTIDGVSVATDGNAFLVAWNRREGGGTILSFARVTVEGEIEFDVADLAAAPRELSAPLVVWNGGHYAVVWSDEGELRTMRISSDGATLDGEVTGWEGIRSGVLRPLAGAVVSGTGSPRLLVRDGDTMRDFAIDADGSLLAVAEGPLSACEERGACIRVFSRVLTGDPWYRASRLFVQPESRSLRQRPVRR